MLSATAYKHVIGVQFDPQKVGGALRPPLSNYLRPAKDARWSVEGDRVAQRDPTIQLIAAETFPLDRLLADGLDAYEVFPALFSQMVASLRSVCRVVPTYRRPWNQKS